MTTPPGFVGRNAHYDAKNAITLGKGTSKIGASKRSIRRTNCKHTADSKTRTRAWRDAAMATARPASGAEDAPTHRSGSVLFFLSKRLVAPRAALA